MPARSGRGDCVERKRVFAAAVHQTLVAHGFPARLGEELRLERHAAADQPVEVRDAAGAVVGDPVFVGTRPHRHVEERRHVVDRIIETTGLLQRRTAAEVDESPGHRRRAAPGPGALDHQHVGAGAGGFHRSGGARDPVSGYDDVGFVVPRRYRRRGDRCYVGDHGRIAAGGSPDHWWPQ